MGVRLLLLGLAAIIVADAALPTMPAKVTDVVFFDITIGGKVAGRIEIGLFGEVVPKTVRGIGVKPQSNARRRCAGPRDTSVLPPQCDISDTAARRGRQPIPAYVMSVFPA